MDFTTIEHLVTKAKVGDEAAKEELFEEFKPMIINISKKTFIHGYDFYDIKHECYASLLKSIKLYNTDTHRFVGYATSAIKNNINYLIRKSLNNKSTQGSETLTLTDNLENIIPNEDDSLEAKVCNKIIAKSIPGYINKLKPNHKEILNFVLINNGSIMDYAKKKNANYSTTAGLKDRALNNLKKQLLN